MTFNEIAGVVYWVRDLGGPGSGNFGHAGRPGERGGSAKGTGGLAVLSNPSAFTFGRADSEFKNKNGKLYDDPNVNGDLKSRIEDAEHILEYGKIRALRDKMERPTRDQHWVVHGDPDYPDGVGYIWHDPGSDHVYIEAISSLDVSKPGTGTRVINYAKKLAKEKGVSKVRLEYTPSSEPYYQKKGWTFEEDGDHAYLKV